MEYKSTLRIPTDQYAYIEIEVGGTPVDIINAYHEFSKLVNPQGIPQKEFNAALDRYLTNGDGEAEVYEQMSRFQKDVIQEIKKSFKRINK